LLYHVKLPYGFNFTNTTTYRGHYKALVQKGAQDDYDRFIIVKNPSAVIFDWKLAWMGPEWYYGRVKFTLDILNVFNKKIAYGPEEGNYLLGRQIWAGLEFNF
jgi:hypothetical protein